MLDRTLQPNSNGLARRVQKTRFLGHGMMT